MTLRTRIPIDECRTRLASAVDRETWIFPLRGRADCKPFVGKVRDTAFRLRMRHGYSNSFAPFLFARFIASDGGTVIEGDFKPHPSVKVFMFFWVSFLVLFAAIVLVLPSRGQPEAPWIRAAMLLAAVVMAGFGVGLMKFGGWLGDGDKGAMVDFLKTTLDAK